MKERLKQLWDGHTRISTQLHIAIGGAIALTLCASVVGWLSFNRVGDAQSRVNEGSIPEIAASFGVSRYSAELVAAAPRLTTASTIEEFDEVVADINDSHEDFEERLTLLEQAGAEEGSFRKIRAHADKLDENIEEIKRATLESFRLDYDADILASKLMNERIKLDAILVKAIDDQLFYLVKGYRKLGEPPALRSEHLSEREIGYYRNLAQLQVDVNIATELLANAFTVSEASLIEPLRERFEAAASRMERNLSALEGSPLHAEVSPFFARLLELGVGEESGFDLWAGRLSLAERQQDLLGRNRDIAIDLVGEVDGLVNTARSSAQAATQASSQAILTGRALLLAISAVSFGGALLIGWLFVGRILVSRLKMLSDWMRRMAGGDLEASVEIGGRDEVADMAAALEVFRRHALEVQRLNLVEKLVEELSEKNDQLESVLADLRRAQDQIVMREKLAALGELTAGVAHEIRNPLNFVNNFSEVSQELVTELQEILKEEGTTLTDEKTGLVEDIFGDLRDNLGRIKSHGERANRIVHDMLQMGRNEGGVQATNINNLLDEHARLAYHSTRATDPNFQLDLLQDFDPDMGELEVIPQEMGRVFLNMVSNACYATDQKRRETAEGSGDAYMPTLLLTTRRGENHAEIAIRDNGSGIPHDAVEKIFNPFFTTKPTDQGTGLGLALCSDIVRRHGGAIRVETEPGQFTVMTVELPLVPPAPVEEEETAEVEAQGSAGTI